MRARLSMIARPGVLLALLSIAASVHAAEEVLRTEANGGNLVMEDVPPIPQQIVVDLNRYQNVRSARFLGWAGEGEGMSAGVYVATRFANVDQIHYVAAPGAARRQLTWFDDPVGQVARQPNGAVLPASPS